MLSTPTRGSVYPVTMMEVQRRLRDLLSLPRDCDAFGGLVLQWSLRRARQDERRSAEIVVQAGRRFDPATRWRGPAPDDKAWTCCYGEGFEARVRPIDGQHCLILVSPKSSFCLEHFGMHLNLAGMAHRYQEAADVSESDFGDASRPWHVRVRGAHHRLMYTALPGIVGYQMTDVGEVYLCLLGVNELALVLLAPDAEPKCLVRGGVVELNGWELLPGKRTLAPPAPVNPARVADLLDELVQLAPVVLEHLSALSRKATREARRLIWALCLAHEKGRRETFHDPDETIYTILVNGGFLDKTPSERTRRATLQWLVDHSPLFRQSFVQRRRVYTVHLEWFGNPTPECRKTMLADQDRG